MKVVYAVVLLALVGFAAADSLPKFPLDWSCIEADTSIVAQGPHSTNGDYVCCPPGETCEVQTQYQRGNNYFDYSNNRTRFDVANASPAYSIVNLFNVNKEIQTDSMLNCQAWCPIGEPLYPFNLEGTGAVRHADKVIDGKTYQDWYWNQTAFGVIVMQTSNMYLTVDSNGVATPFQQLDELTPFGEPIGSSTSSWSNWVAGTPDASLFAVKGLDKCPMANNCNSNELQQHRLAARMFKTWYYYSERGMGANGAYFSDVEQATY